MQRNVHTIKMAVGCIALSSTEMCVRLEDAMMHPLLWICSLYLTNWVVYRNGEVCITRTKSGWQCILIGTWSGRTRQRNNQKQQTMLESRWHPASHAVGASGDYHTSLVVLDEEKPGTQKPWPSAITAPFSRPWELLSPRAVQWRSQFSTVEAESGFADTAPCHFLDRHQNCTWHLVGGCYNLPVQFCHDL